MDVPNNCLQIISKDIMSKRKALVSQAIDWKEVGFHNQMICKKIIWMQKSNWLRRKQFPFRHGPGWLQFILKIIENIYITINH